MPIKNYGLLTGHPTVLVPQHGHNPHYLLYVQSGSVAYKVSLNVLSTVSPAHSSPPELQFQFVGDLANSKLAPVRNLAAAIANTNSFQLAVQHPSLPRLDYVRGGILDLTKFAVVPSDARLSANRLLQELSAAVADATRDPKSFVAVFGVGHAAAEDPGTHHKMDPLTAAFGFNGLENVHMNQGSDYRVGRHLNNQFQENGPNQDGAVLFYLSSGVVKGFFFKFTSQELQTDANGNPLHTGVPQIDKHASNKKLQKLIENPYPKLLSKPATRPPKRPRTSGNSAVPAASPAAHVSMQPPHPTPIGGGTAAPLASSSGFVFNDPLPADPNHTFVPDDDSAVRNSPFVANFAKYGVPEPVPGPRDSMYPILKLEDILGSAAVKSIRDSKQIAFHAVGDTGAPDLTKLPHETAVSDLMIQEVATLTPPDRPNFLFHLGDVVYYYGESQYYYDQFFKPFKDYAGPIFAIPGNHDGITYSDSMTSLAGFIEAFCDSAPNHPKSAGGINRTSMIQPAVYFTLDAPFVSIIGLYSNCSESYGYLDAQQKLFLHNELLRLKPLRDSGEILAVVLAIHHPPLSYSPQKPSSTKMRDDIDAACSAAGLYPDAVLSGHAHIYQRIVRTITVGRSSQDIPYIIAGAGGYNMNKNQEIDKADMKLKDVSDPQFRLHQFFPNYGFLRVIVKSKAANQAAPRGSKLDVPTLRIEFRSTDPGLGSPADACVVDLENRRLL